MGVPVAAIPDVQAQRPSRALGLTRAGVSGLERVLVLPAASSVEVHHLRVDGTVDLAGDRRGAHMSRFEEGLDSALAEAAGGAAPLAPDALAARIAEEVRERQEAARAEVAVEARTLRRRAAPVSGIETQQPVILLGRARATAAGTRRIVGAQAQGMTACPCAQEGLAEAARERLAGDGFAPEEIERILEHVPVATHNQRGLGTLEVGVAAGAPAPAPGALLAIVEAAMSAEIFELMKRADEAAVVERAHRRPRFVEDCVREMVAGVVERLPELGDGALVRAHQQNLETIHRHDVEAECVGLLGALRGELAGAEPSPRAVSVDEWLAG